MGPVTATIYHIFPRENSRAEVQTSNFPAGRGFWKVRCWIQNHFPGPMPKSTFLFCIQADFTAPETVRNLIFRARDGSWGQTGRHTPTKSWVPKPRVRILRRDQTSEEHNAVFGPWCFSIIMSIMVLNLLLHFQRSGSVGEIDRWAPACGEIHEYIYHPPGKNRPGIRNWEFSNSLAPNAAPGPPKTAIFGYWIQKPCWIRASTPLS